jgi:hypothetical protein
MTFTFPFNLRAEKFGNIVINIFCSFSTLSADIFQPKNLLCLDRKASHFHDHAQLPENIAVKFVLPAMCKKLHMHFLSLSFSLHLAFYEIGCGKESLVALVINIFKNLNI